MLLQLENTASIGVTSNCGRTSCVCVPLNEDKLCACVFTSVLSKSADSEPSLPIVYESSYVIINAWALCEESSLKTAEIQREREREGHEERDPESGIWRAGRGDSKRKRKVEARGSVQASTTLIL